MTVFDDLATAIGQYVGGAEVAGFILGFTVIALFLFGFALVFGTKVFNGPALIILSVFPMVFVTLVGWFPLWVPFVVIIVILALWWIPHRSDA